MSEWESFYVIVGSSGAALIGIQFVVMTLIAGRRQRPTLESLSAFGTPTVVHFVGALLVAAIMSAPWHSFVPPSIALVTCGIGGIAYSAVVLRRARRQTEYRPVWQDWLWYALLPSGAYAALALAAAFLRSNTRLALVGIGAAALGLLLIGIHNAWDTVTHIIVTDALDAEKTEPTP
jgi:protein-S-isoprenylcysteine O-methyltransferase Ste14